MVKRCTHPEYPELTEPTVQESQPLFFNKIREVKSLLKNMFKKKEDCSSIKHAKRELILAGYDLNEKEEGPNKWIVENIIELLNVFSKQGHSGFSALYSIDIFSKLAKHEILTPLTGEDSEWNEVTEPSDKNRLWQNNRCSTVFKDEKRIWNMDGKVFIDENNCSYTNIKSRVYIKSFPYVPVTKYVKVKE
jgi:hypothetical protein